VKLLRCGGVLSFISSNKYYRAGYGEKLRAFLARELTLLELLDFGDAPVFDAIAYASILIGRKSPPVTGSVACAVTWPPDRELENFSETLSTLGVEISQRDLQPDGWRLEAPALLRLIEKLRRAGTPLAKYVNDRFYYGIKTGLNEAFVIDRATRDRLISEHRSSVQVLKPFLRGRDVKRWSIEFAEQYLVKIESSENKRHPWSGESESEAEQTFREEFSGNPRSSWSFPARLEKPRRPRTLFLGIAFLHLLERIRAGEDRSSDYN
jgi:adenine-specific DNA-methyltransferase